jgi:hypothetical protein
MHPELEVNHRTFCRPYVHLIAIVGLEAGTSSIDTPGYAVARPSSTSQAPKCLIIPRDGQRYRAVNLATVFPCAL